MGSCGSKETEPPTKTASSLLAKRVQQQKQVSSSTGSNKSGSNGTETEKKPAATPEAASEAANGQSGELVSTSDKELKVLLLGSGESGKSTIVKQMKILHKNGFSSTEAYEYKPFVYKNVLECVKNIINAIFELQPDLVAPQGAEVATEGTTHILNHQELQDIMRYDLSVSTDEVFSSDIAQKIKRVYERPEVLEFTKVHQGHFYLVDSTSYFLSNVSRIATPGYVPTQEDILRTRKKTSGIFDFRFEMGGLNIHMFDVGGQRSERKKWIHCFDNVTLIIFCVALSEYDQVLLEENTQNRLEESLTLFDSVVNSRWFSRTSVVLFLNKIDVFASKLPYSPLEKYFPDYNGGDNINKAVKYILWRFTQVNRSGINIYPHVTQATDTSNIQLVFAAVKETILENTLRDSGIL